MTFCSCLVAKWATESPTTTWRGMDRMPGSHHFVGCPLFTTVDQLRRDRALNRLSEWLPAKGANPIDGQAYWVACASLAKSAPGAFVAIGFWDSKAGGFR